MPDLPTCEHDVTLPPPGDVGFCPLCLRARLAEVAAERDFARREAADAAARLIAVERRVCKLEASADGRDDALRQIEADMTRLELGL